MSSLMESDQQDQLNVLEVNKRLLTELEEMGFPRIKAARALHCSGNTGIEAAINWIVDHENDPDIDPMPLIAMNIDIDDSPQPFQTTEEMQIKSQELRNPVSKKKEDEEKKLEREREKERSLAGKKILEAKRIVEDNERKRYLASRRAEKEEEKRAREKVRQKLEADKEASDDPWIYKRSMPGLLALKKSSLWISNAERRRMLGLPSECHTTTKLSKHSTKEKKNYVCITSATKAEQLRECLRSLKRNHKDADATVKRAFQTLLIYVGNVAMNPEEEKFRKIRIRNPLFQDRVGRLKGGIEFLQLCGFERIEDDNFLFLPRDKVDLALLNSAGMEIKSAMTNPFFGLLSHV